MAKHSEYLKTLPLAEALWWFIENSGGNPADTSEYFFALRERVRNEPTSPPPIEQAQPDPLIVTDRELAHIVAALEYYARDQAAELRDGEDWTKEGRLQGRFEWHARMTDEEVDNLAIRLGARA